MKQKTKRIVSLLLVTCMVAAFFQLTPSFAGERYDYASYLIDTDGSVRLSMSGTTKTIVYAKFLLKGAALPSGLPDDAVELTCVIDDYGTVNSFAGVLNIPEVTGVYGIAYTVNKGAAWYVRYGDYGNDSIVVLPGKKLAVYGGFPTITWEGMTAIDKLLIEVNNSSYEDVYGVVRPIGSPRPAYGEVPSDAFKFTRIYGYWNKYYRTERLVGQFTWPSADGEYIIYWTCTNGALWEYEEPYRSGGELCLMVRDGKPLSYKSLHSEIGWFEEEKLLYATLEDGVITARVYSGCDFSNPYELFLVNEYTGEALERKKPDGTEEEVNDGGVYDRWNYTYYARFALPEEPGFYKVYMTAFDITYEAYTAFWVKDDGSVVEVNMFSGINGAPKDSMIVYPVGVEVPSWEEQMATGRFIPCIDLSMEVLHASPALYSFDGGRTWKSINNFSLEKIISSKTGFTLTIADKAQNRDKTFSEDTTFYTFPYIAPRPEKTKLIPNYIALYLDENPVVPSLETMPRQTFWTLTESKDDIIATDGIEIAYLFGDGTPTAYGTIWYDIPQTGIPVLPLRIIGTYETDGFIHTYSLKQQSQSYQIRVAPKALPDGTYVPGAALQKITAKSLEKPKVVKPDYKKGVVKAPKGTMYKSGGKGRRGDGKTTEEIDGYNISYRKTPSRKSPGSVFVTHEYAEPTTFDPKTTTIKDGKLKADKSLEFSYGDGRWGSFKAPRGEQNGVILVRSKPKGRLKPEVSYESGASAAVTDDANDFQAASEAYEFTYVWGEYTKADGKTAAGITSFNFNPAA